MRGQKYLHHIDSLGRFHGRDDDNLIAMSLVVGDSQFGDAVKVYIDNLTLSANSAEIFFDAKQAEELGGQLLLLAVKLNQIAELHPYKAKKTGK